MPGIPLVMAAPPAASTPTSRAPVSTKPANVPAGVGAAPDAGHDHVGFVPVEESLGLRRRLFAHHPLKLAHHVGKRVRAHDRAQAVVGVIHGGHPVAHGLVHRVLQGTAPREHRSHLGPQQFHPEDVELLALGVDFAHVDRALQAEEGGGSGRRHPVLPGPGLGDEASLPHAPGQECLARPRCSTCGSRCGPGPPA